MNVIQIQPNHADHISLYRTEYLQKMFEEEPVIAQLKYDGERMLIHFYGTQIVCTSRRISKKTGLFMQNEDKLPKLREAYANSLHFTNTVIDCECYANTWSESASVLHSLPDRAKELQDSGINIRYAVFDCLFYDGKDLRNLPYLKRLEYAQTIVANLNIPGMHLVKFINDKLEPDDISKVALLSNDEDWKRAMENAISSGFEGIVVKSLSKAYYDKAASLKCKKFETVDVVVIDKQTGTGKYSNTVGALIVGYYDPDKDNFVAISRVNCGTDADRDWWRDNWNTAKYSVLEVKCQEITGKSLRHPVYIRKREDKSYKMCTKETIFKEM